MTEATLIIGLVRLVLSCNIRGQLYLLHQQLAARDKPNVRASRHPSSWVQTIRSKLSFWYEKFIRSCLTLNWKETNNFEPTNSDWVNPNRRRKPRKRGRIAQNLEWGTPVIFVRQILTFSINFDAWTASCQVSQQSKFKSQVSARFSKKANNLTPYNDKWACHFLV